MKTENHDPVNNPSLYAPHPNGRVYIELTQHFDFCLGNAIKYILLACEKSKGTEKQDLEKALWYLSRKIEKLYKESPQDV